MTEIEAIDKIKIEVEKTTKGYEVKVVQRDFTARAKYIATIGIICQEGVISQEVIQNMVNLCINGENDDMKINGTQINMKDLKYDVMLIDVEIVL